MSFQIPSTSASFVHWGEIRIDETEAQDFLGEISIFGCMYETCQHGAYLANTHISARNIFKQKNGSARPLPHRHDAITESRAALYQGTPQEDELTPGKMGYAISRTRGRHRRVMALTASAGLSPRPGELATS